MCRGNPLPLFFSLEYKKHPKVISKQAREFLLQVQLDVMIQRFARTTLILMNRDDIYIYTHTHTHTHSGAVLRGCDQKYKPGVYSSPSVFPQGSYSISFQTYLPLKEEKTEKRVSEDKMAQWHHQCNGNELGQTWGDGEGQGGLQCCSPWGRRELDTTE